jgi:ribosomal protein S18 acetylase RimI-like enzyme
MDLGLNFTNLKSGINEPKVAEILSLCAFDGSASGVCKIIKNCENDPGLNFWGATENGEILGVCEFRVLPRSLEITHIAVAENFQRRGVGRFIIEKLTENFNLPIEAETDADGRGFYEKVGFLIEDAPDKFGTKRFLCKLNFK